MGLSPTLDEFLFAGSYVVIIGLEAVLTDYYTHVQGRSYHCFLVAQKPPPGAAEKIGQGSLIIEIKQPCPSFHARGCKSCSTVNRFTLASFVSAS